MRATERSRSSRKANASEMPEALDKVAEKATKNGRITLKATKNDPTTNKASNVKAIMTKFEGQLKKKGETTVAPTRPHTKDQVS